MELQVRGPIPKKRAFLILGGWLVVGLWLAAQAWVAGEIRGAPVAGAKAVLIWSAWATIWAALTPLALKIEARFPFTQTGAARAIALHATASIVFAATSLAAFAIVAPYVGSLSAGSTWLASYSRLIGTTFLLTIPVYWFIVGAAHMVRLTREAHERERRALQLEAQLSDARLAALRAQLQPHFLFNALNTVSVLMHEDIEAADRTLVLLSGLLRRVMEASTAQEVPLREEIAFLETYLAMEQARFTNRLSFQVDVEPQLLDAWVPNLVLQPLVENAVRHGLADREIPVHILVSASTDGTRLRLAVMDNGQGIQGQPCDGIGLSNTRARLQLLYGDQQTFELSKSDQGGLLALLNIPLRRAAPA